MNGIMILSGIILLAINFNVIGYRNITNAIVKSDTFVSAATNKGEQDYQVRKEIHQTFHLPPNGVIDVSGIEGAVEVATTGGSMAEISFVREAPTQRDFYCETITIEQSSAKLVISHQTNKGKQCHVIEAREHLKLSVPRSTNLNFRNIEGDFTIGATEGFLRLSNIEGFVRIEQAQAAEISSIESGLSLNVAEINSPGININNIEGEVELGVKKDLNAQLKINSRNVEIAIPNIQSTSSRQRNYQFQLGTGGENISISNIEGGVKVRGI